MLQRFTLYLRENIKGFSLIEVAVTVGVMALVSLGIAGSFSFLFQGQGAVTARNEANEFLSSLGQYFYSENLCTSGIDNVPFNVNPAIKTNLTINNYEGYGSRAGIPVTNGFVVERGTEVKQLFIRNKGVPPVAVRVDGVDYSQYVGQVVVEMEVSGFGTGAKKSLPLRYYEFPVLVDAGNRIRRCQVDMSLSEACSSSGGTFDPATMLCNPASQCQIHGTYVQSSCSPAWGGCAGEGEPNHITGAQSCPSGVTANQTGIRTYTRTVSCGKKCSYTVTITLKYFVCMAC